MKTLCRIVVSLGWTLGFVTAASFLFGAIAAPALAHRGDWLSADALYELFSLSCQQQGSHSFWLWGYPMAVCARCAGIYMGIVFGTFVVFTRWFGFSFAEPRLGKSGDPLLGSSGPLGVRVFTNLTPLLVWLPWILFLALVDKFITWTVGWEPPVAVRLVSGLLLGFFAVALWAQVLYGVEALGRRFGGQHPAYG